jgi:hypothetical protein
MTKKRTPYPYIVTALLTCFLQVAGIDVYGQEPAKSAQKRVLVVGDTIAAPTDTLQRGGNSAESDTLTLPPPVSLDSLQRALNAAPKFVPSPVKATWLALAIPGGGQIYNKKYWKLPIIYGGFAGCAYALTWNGKMYKDYAQAFKDAANDNWTASSIVDLLPPGYTDRVSHSQITETLRRRKDMYRRYRDLSIFAFIGVYLISVVDAYVDAELSNFDLSPDLSLRIEPTVINSQPK